MRILLVSRFGHEIGGIEVHLRHLLSALSEAGHAVAYLYQEQVPGEGRRLAPAEVPQYGMGELGTSGTLDWVRQWAPDVVYAHQVVEPSVMQCLQREWPSLYFAHCYLGACISTTRCWKRPRPRPCQRPFGWGCLLHYFPHGCGGRNPLAMWRLFREQRRVQTLIHGFQRLATHSDHVRRVYVQHGFPHDRAERIPFWVEPSTAAPFAAKSWPATGPVRLLFLGRFDVLKGGDLLLAALPCIAALLDRPVHLTLAGEGPERERWQRLADRANRADTRVTVTLPGWLRGPALDAALEGAHVLAVPSVWPEPFGMTGIEAGAWGLPSVAYDVGGIREWLENGVNGVLATCPLPEARALAEAMAQCLQDPDRFHSLSRGAVAAVRRFGKGAHLAAVQGLLVRCVAGT